MVTKRNEARLGRELQAARRQIRALKRQLARSPAAEPAPTEAYLTTLNEARRLSQSTIDALTQHICVLDETCTILTVNRAWHVFAAANPPVDPDHYIGANYLEVCDAAEGAGAAEAASIGAGIRAVLRGERDSFSLEYPCDSPWGERRWFLATVTRFAGEGPTRLVIAHANITQQKQIEKALQHQHGSAAALLQLSQTLDGASSYEDILRATHAQLWASLGFEQVRCYLFDDSQLYAWSLAVHGAPPAVEVSGLGTRQPIKGDARLAAMAAADEPQFVEVDDAAAGADPAADPPRRGQMRMHIALRLNGRQIGALEAGMISAPRVWQLTVHERAFLTALARSVAATLDRIRISVELRALFATMADGVVYQNAEGQITFANLAAERILGHPLSELRGHSFREPGWSTYREDGTPFPGEEHPSFLALQSGRPVLNTVMGLRQSAEQPARWVVVNATPQLRPGESAPYQVFTTFTDISERKRAEEEHRESEERMRSFIEQSSEGVVMTDEAGRILEWNRALEDLTGIPRAEAIEMTFWDVQSLLTPPGPAAGARAPGLRQIMELALKTGQSSFFGKPVDGVLQARNGQLKAILQTSFPIKTDQGYRIGSVIRDVSERKRNETALIESEEKYRSLIESQEAAIAAVDAEGVYHYMNRIAAATLGGTPASLVGRSMRELFPPEAAEPQLRNIRQVIAAGVGMVSEARTLVAGKPRWYRTSLQPVRDASGAVRVVLVNAMDITERKEAEIVLEERVHQRTAEIESIRQRLELATRSAGIGIWDWNCESGQILWDDQMLALYGIGRDGFAGTFAAWEQRVHPEDMPEQLARIQAALRGEREFNTDFRVIWPDHSEHHLHAKALTLFDDEGRPLRMIGVNYDITVRKTAELVLRQREETLQQANAELARANRAKDEFLANMSHELRTPLNGILALSEALLEQTRGPLNERQAKSLQSIETSGRHLLALINDILDVSKIEAGKLDLAPDLLDLNDLCQTSLAFVKEPAMKRSVALHFSSDAPNLTIYADARRIKQILINLLSNAVKFTAPGGHVSLEVNADDREGVVNFAVEDTGIGIAPEDIERLFTPFVQVDTSLTRQHEGSGLGLALVSRLVRLHGGKVSVSSQVGQGSRFAVALPWVAPPDTEAPVAHEPSGVGFMRALVVENSPIAAEQLATYLRRMQIDVQTELSPHEALAHAVAFQPQLIFLDLLMPDTSGWEVLAALKADPRTQTIATVIVSILDERQAALQAGADEYLLKPYTRSQLQQVVHKLAARVRQPPVAAPDAGQGKRCGLVLLVEDSLVNIDSVSDYLQFHGYEVLVANNGQEGLALAEARQPDLILMDIQMPVMDGLEATRRLRALPSLAATPVIALTALAMAGDRERCLQAGATAYLSKPVSLKDLLALTRKLLGREPAGGVASDEPGRALGRARP